MRLLLVVITFAWFCFGIGFSVYDLKIPSIALAVTGLIAFLSALINYRQNAKKENPSQSQKIEKNSFGMQAGGDFNINLNKDKNDE